jgi:ABC-type transporter Mla maintaining outer membrane lipid asymmetry ATPase subunit MlaF
MTGTKMTDDQFIVQMKNVSTELGGVSVNKNLSLDVRRGEILALVGGSGAGKTTV